MRALFQTLTTALIVGLTLTGTAAGEPSMPRFAEETASAGINSVYTGEWEFIVGGGAAAFDCNGDEFPDMMLAGGTSKSKLFVNRSKAGSPLKFEESQSGLELEGVTGAYPIDIDSDGLIDLVVLRVGENIVMRGKGECRFERANESWGFEGGDAWSTAMAATFERGSDWPSVAIGNYINREEEFSPWGSCTDNWLHRPNTKKPGSFAAPLALKPSHCALSMLFTDWNRSGTPSLRVSNDREYYEGGEEQMWRLEAGKEPQLFGPADGWQRLRIWGMGIASHDIDFDGYPEYFLTSMADNKLQKLKVQPDGAPKPQYDDIAYKSGVTAHRPFQGEDLRPSTAWHTQFEDVNNDGLADIFIAKGNVEKMPDFAMADPNNLLIQAADGKFVEGAALAGVDSTRISRGAALADFNMDGLVDLVVVNRKEGAQLWRNSGMAQGANGSNFLSIRLMQDGTNRDAIGSWIEVEANGRIARKEITIGGGHAGGQLGWWHFGLADATAAKIRVIWPDGTQGTWQELATNGFYLVAPNAPARRWTPQ